MNREAIQQLLIWLDQALTKPTDNIAPLMDYANSDGFG
jgi:hypothetical protein